MEHAMNTITRESVKNAYNYYLCDGLPQSRSYMLGYIKALCDMGLMSDDEEARIRACIARRIPRLTDYYICSDLESED